ncbi:MAG: ShlB/FhaC/HecB family hemolysin secretion/activation protein [Micavibrio sp.]
MNSRMRLCAISAMTAGLLGGLSPSALAQLTDQTTTANPSRVQEQLGGAVFDPRVMPRVEVREGVLQQAPAGAEKINFKLDRLNIEGVSAYDQDELNSMVADKLGQTITLAELYAIAADITRKYRNDGYILTQVVVPPQTIEGGTARLQVVEGYIGNVEVRGNGDHIEDAVQLARGYALLVQGQSAALNVRQLERALLMINDIPGVSARSILSPSESAAGAADLLIMVERDTFEGQFSLDNHGSRYLGPVQVGAAAISNGLLGLNERVSAQMAYAPDEDFHDELVYLGLGYAMPVWKYGTMLDIAVDATETDPGYTLDAFDVKGSSRHVSIGMSHPFARTRNFNLTGRFSFDWRNVETKNNVENPRKDNIRSVRAGGRVEFIDSLMNVAYNILDVELAHGLGIMNASTDRDTNVSRPGADSDFFKMEAEYQRLQRLTSKVNVLLGVKGQWSDEALFSTEEFGVGGVSYGRGYDPSEIIGDDGIAGKIELQWNNPTAPTLIEHYQLYSFFDAGTVWDKDATTSDLKQETATSAGFGVRADLTPSTQTGAFVAWPLNRRVETQGDSDPRFYLNVSHKF